MTPTAPQAPLPIDDSSVPTPVRLDANLGWLFTEEPLEQRFESAARAGFRAVEFPDPYACSPASLRKRLDDAGLEQVLINSPAGAPDSPTRNGSACMPDRVSEFRDGMLAALQYATELGADVIHVLGGIRPDGVTREDALDTYRDNLRWCVEQASPTAVTLAIEALNHGDAPGFVLDSSEHAAEVVEAIAHPRLGLLFDAYHCARAGEDPAERLRALIDVTVHVQVADAPGRGEPGSGTIAWERFFEQLRALRYRGWVGCEYRPVAGTRDGLAWRERLNLLPETGN
ncbi:hydroxypyruvate isomerase family protein [Conexibacter sp. CPCC 206217]|uniref:hydroxypyruvate isomerase family protein n=1 Tax=Conexibacter sp. CPCC 206217 TaxID=3064574 RepID=UPI00272572FB|nr:TIM barrel protein [Conexibacter sp. CPCC 206217]MDO8213165.1 TIM barrel protein [Conexibacter sp. CPCC 206217]